ncbi:MAG: hypothetical protein LBP55_06245 [Candidatus Adiutrix sp.]|jgi:predicted Fe-Mo cluster-binding NifX family protein|nr:hypothetical protein [Candidatus Adiutrix sp.]
MADIFSSRPGRVAVATEDGVMIDCCFGRARAYHIYEANARADGYHFMEIRPSPIPCRDQDHDPETLNRAIELLADCQLVLAGKIGPEAIRRLEARGIPALAVSLSMAEAFKRLNKRKNVR